MAKNFLHNGGRARIVLEYLELMKVEQTTVVWRVEGKNTFPGRVMCLFMNMDKQVGGFFEKGLNKLKTIVEKGN